MSLLIRILVVIVALGVAVLVQNYRQLARPIPLPEFDLKAYWGPGSADKYKEDTAVKSFDISTKPEIIEDLKAQLNRPLKLHAPLEGIGFEYGFNTNELSKIVKYWRDTYLPKWNQREAYLNQFEHYQTQIQGLNIHFMHVKPKKTKEEKEVLPVLLLHGWPGSVREFYDLIPLLTKPNPKSRYIFEVIAPSLPGYGWSQASSKVNLGPAEIGVILRNLMVRLGHKKFIIQGGDWGSLIGSNMAAIFPDNVIGYHSNMCSSNHPLTLIKTFLSGFLPSFIVGPQDPEFFKPMGEFMSYIIAESGYFHLQATKPDTIGTVLHQNPVGLAAYILEKFSTWTNAEYTRLPDGGLNNRFALDALLDNVMIYYVTGSITTSQRLYAEAFSKSELSLQLDRIPLKQPSGCARFKHDLMHLSDFQLKDKFINLVHSTYHKNGGHFAAMEVPTVLYNDFIDFLQKAFNVE